jgi:hypothetical protein
MKSQSLHGLLNGCFSTSKTFVSPLKAIMTGLLIYTPVLAEPPAQGIDNSFGSKASEAPPMLQAENGYQTHVLFTVGDPLPSSPGRYIPPGILDGVGALERDSQTVRFLVNHELKRHRGYPFTITEPNPVTFTGARISAIDVNKETLEITYAGLAFEKIIDATGNAVEEADQIEGGLNRFCSGSMFQPHQFGTGRGFEDPVFAAGEEAPDGRQFFLETGTGTLHQAPDLGRGRWENITLIDSGDPDTVAILLGDDYKDAPLYLYLGTKQHGGGFLARNGLKGGKLFAWKADGSWIPLQHFIPAKAGQAGYDRLGYALDNTLREQAVKAGARRFSRPEDLATNPAIPTQAVLNSTGHPSAADGDTCGATYLLDSTFTEKADGLPEVTTEISTLYSCTDSLPEPAYRNPDNLDWSLNGKILIQEDESGQWPNNRPEAGVLSLNPVTGKVKRLATINREVVLPFGSTDKHAGNLGAWESSGVLDVSNLFGRQPGTLLALTIQAHGITDGTISALNLVQGGQFLLLEELANP